MEGNKPPLVRNGYLFTQYTVEGPYSSLMKVEVYKVGEDGSLKNTGKKSILGISHTREVVRVGLFRRKIVTLHFDPLTSGLSIED